MSDTLFSGEQLTGEVLGVMYADSSTGFGVVELDPETGGGGARCSGPLSDLVEGQTVTLVGAWKEHQKYGLTFEAVLYEQVTPTTVAGLRSFLLSERFEHIDPDDLDRVMSAFGKQAGTIIEQEPERLAAEARIDPTVADDLHAAWMAGQSLSELTRLAEPAGLPFDVIRAVHRRFGADAAKVARDDPYQLLEVERCRFAHADALARHLGLEQTDRRRLAAGARAAVAAGRRRDGHQYLTRDQVTAESARILKVDAVLAADGLEVAVAEGTLARDRIRPDGVRTVAVYTPAGLRAEQKLTRELHRLLTTEHARLVAYVDDVDPANELTAGQAEAVRGVFASPVSVLTGGPGTGKTRTIQEVVRAAENADLNIALCAPTGRAAKRVEELVGRPATTIHKMLEARPMPGGGFVFRYGYDEHLPYDLVVADEVSMCDTSLAASLIAAVDDGAHLLLVGDPDQLPSVGPGDVLRDIIRSEVVPMTELTEVHRQAAESRIVTLANEINRGQVGVLKGNDGDVFLAEEQRHRIVARVVEAVANRAPEYFGVEVDDVQVVAPMYRGPAGVDAVNAALKEALNPSGGRPDVAGFNEGDRVMQTRNDTDLDVSNGDIGRVVDLDARKRTLRVAFPRGEVTYDKDQARELTAAWCITVHKSQGGEWPVVVLVCERSHRNMLWRNLVYTAVTRAQRALIVIGQGDALREAARHDVPRNRQTALAFRLRQLLGSEANVADTDGDDTPDSPDTTEEATA